MTDATPKRIQRKRTRGWKMPADTVCVCRPGKFGNHWSLEKARYVGFTGSDRELQGMCVNFFRNSLARNLPATAKAVKALSTLTGKNLACWCRLCPDHADGKPFTVECAACEPCHSDVLGRAAND